MAQCATKTKSACQKDPGCKYSRMYGCVEDDVYDDIGYLYLGPKAKAYIKKNKKGFMARMHWRIAAAMIKYAAAKALGDFAEKFLYTLGTFSKMSQPTFKSALEAVQTGVPSSFFQKGRVDFLARVSDLLAKSPSIGDLMPATEVQTIVNVRRRGKMDEIASGALDMRRKWNAFTSSSYWQSFRDTADNLTGTIPAEWRRAFSDAVFSAAGASQVLSGIIRADAIIDLVFANWDAADDRLTFRMVVHIISTAFIVMHTMSDVAMGPMTTASLLMIIAYRLWRRYKTNMKSLVKMVIGAASKAFRGLGATVDKLKRETQSLTAYLLKRKGRPLTAAQKKDARAFERKANADYKQSLKDALVSKGMSEFKASARARLLARKSELDAIQKAKAVTAFHKRRAKRASRKTTAKRKSSSNKLQAAREEATAAAQARAESAARRTLANSGRGRRRRAAA